MTTASRFRRLLITLAVVMAAAACSDDVTTSDASTPPTGDVFDTTRHVVLEGIEHDGFETITVLAHLCPIDDRTCPDGDEDLVVLASRHLAPGQIYLADPEVYLEPPEVCLSDDMACRMSVVHCEFANEADQRDTGYCLPSRAAVAQVGAAVASDAGHPCVERRAERSHHIDYGCLTGRATS
jgi:hypothetical protein